jgi:predicted ATPase
VAYESQLKSDRAQLHRRLAAEIEAREPQSADQNAALIAEHLEAAGDVDSRLGDTDDGADRRRITPGGGGRVIDDLALAA